MRPTLIYGLKDPNTGLIRYVGKTQQPATRKCQHRADTTHTHRGRWIRSIGGKFEMIELEWVVGFDWVEREKYWVKFYADTTTNHTEGGDGGPSGDDGDMERLRLAMLGNQLAKGYVHTDEAKEKIAEANRGTQKALGHRHSDEAKERIGRATRGTTKSQETIDRMKATHALLSDKKSEDMNRVWAERKAEGWEGKNTQSEPSIVAEYQAGVPQLQIATKYGISSSTLYQILKRHGVEIGQRRQAKTPEEMREYKRLFAQKARAAKKEM